MHLPDSLRLRSICDGDLPLLREIYCASRAAELMHLEWTAHEKSEFLHCQFALQDRYYRAHFPRAELLVIRRREEDIGRLYLDWGDTQLRLIDIALLERWRRQGIGSSLLRSVLAEADERRVAVILHVEENNAARSLYRRLGFAEVAGNGVYVRLQRQSPALAA